MEARKPEATTSEFAGCRVRVGDERGRGSPYLTFSVCLHPHLSNSAQVSPFPSGCVCKSISLWFCPFPHFLPVSSSSILSAFQFSFLGCVFPSPSYPLPISLCPVSFSVSPSSLLLFFLAPGIPPVYLLPPTPRYVSLHFFPRLSPHTTLPRPKGTLVLNLDRLRCGKKLQLRQPPEWSFAPPPPPLPTFPTCCMPGVGGREMPASGG